MIRACCSAVIALVAAALALTPGKAATMADPQALYNQMMAAYNAGASHGWTFASREFYLATVFDAGRAYALQLPNDPNFPRIEQMTVDLATELHYDPLIFHDAADWYVRQAAIDVQNHPSDPAEAQKASDVLSRADAMDDPATLARLADADGEANVQAFPRDGDALVARVEADWRAWLITHDRSWRALALLRAAEVGFPVQHLPQTWGPAFLEAARAAAHGSSEYTQAERDNAQLVLESYAKQTPLNTIADVKSEPSHGFMMTILAPADEYFGPMGMSVLGIQNELHRINAMIGYGYARQQSAQAIEVAVSIDDLHKVYPRDRDIPKFLLEAIDTLGKIDTPEAAAARRHLVTVLTIEYQDSKQAQDILKSL